MSARLPPGTVIEGFTLGECIHDGGMGFIYRVSATDDPGFPLIMKLPRIGQGQPVEGLVGFEMEAMILQRVQGPHVPRFVAAGDIATTPFLVMEWVEGVLLEKRAAQAPLPVPEIACIGAAIAEALDDLHRQDLLHLDLKPGNILMRSDGSAVLIDFGLAHHGRLPDLLAEELRRAIGSPPYLSPEQVLGTRNDPRSDQFALGVVLYELATGELPFGAPASVSGLRDRLWLEPRPPRALNPQLPPWLQEVILRALEPLARDRYPSLAQMAAHLRNPSSIDIGERGQRMRRSGVWAHLRRWLRAAGREAEILAAAPSEHRQQAPIVVAAVDVEHLQDDLQRALQSAVARVIANAPGARLAAVSILRPTPAFDAADEKASASALHRDRLALLRHWTEPMGLPAERVSIHVIEAGDKARALLEYARGNHASLIVLGAAHYSEPALGLGRSLTTEVVEEAGCSVYVVKAGARPVLGR